MSNKVGGILCCGTSPNKYERLDTKLEKKMMEVKRSSLGPNNFRSIDGIILRFPQFREGLKEIRGVFEQYGEFQQFFVDYFYKLITFFFYLFNLSLICTFLTLHPMTLPLACGGFPKYCIKIVGEGGGGEVRLVKVKGLH